MKNYNRTIEQSNNRTIEQSNNRTIEQSNNRTIEQSNNRTIFRNILFILLVIFSIPLKAQTLAEHHNLILERLFSKGDYQEFKLQEVVKEINSYGSIYNFQSIDTSLQSIKSTYFENVTDWKSFYQNLLNKRFISIGLHSFMTEFGISLKAANFEMNDANLTSFIAGMKTNSKYTSLNSADKLKLDTYFEGIKKSATFWKKIDTEDQQKSRRCRCRLGCSICVALFDIGGLLIPVYGWAVGPLASFIARCCICSCCNNVNCFDRE